MQFESLEVFCDVARTRSFSQAALVNKVTQSAVSQMVAQLEKRLGVQLIDRSTRPLQLTSLGKEYYEGCKALLEQYGELEASLRSAQARVEGSVQVAAIYSVGLGNMNQYVEEFVSHQPEAEVHIEYLHPDDVYEKVLDGSADLGLVSFPRRSSKLTILPWRDEPMVFVCASRHPFANQTSVKINQLSGQKFIHFSKELVIRREVDRFLRHKKVSIEVALEFDNIENIKKAVEIGAGVALLPEPTLRNEVTSGTLIALPLSDASLVRPLGIIYRRHHKLSQAAQGFLNLLRRPCENGTSDFPDKIFTEGEASNKNAHRKSPNSRNGSAHPSPNRKKKR